MFNNPIKVQQLGAASVPQPVQDTSTATALSGLTDIIRTLDSSAKKGGPESWQVKSKWETEGHTAAIEDAQQYQFLVDQKGRQAADVWLNKQVLTRQGGLNADAADSYRQVIGDTIGKSSTVLDREFERKEQERSQSRINDLVFQGQQLAMADGARYGVDPTKLSQDKLIAMAMTYEGNKARADEASRNVALQQSQLNLTSSQRVLKSEVAANNFLETKTTETQALIFSVLEGIKQSPTNADKTKLLAITDLEQRKARALSDASATIVAAGGDVSDIKAGQIDSVGKQYDAAIALIRGDYGVQLDKANLESLTIGTALAGVRKMPSEMSNLILMQNAIRMPLNAAAESALKTDFKYDPNAQYEVIRNLRLGVNTAVQNTGEPVRRWADTLVAAAPAVIKNPSMHKDYGSALVNSLAESFQAPLNIRQQASSPDSLPNMMEKLARSGMKGELGQSVVDAAAAEGMTPAELWQKSSVGVLREKIGPSLLKGDPFIMKNVDVKYSGGKFTLKINEQKYRQEANLSFNPSYYSGMSDPTKMKIDKINKDLGIFQQFLNNSVQSYSKVTGGNPDDVGLALEQVVQVTFGLQNIE